MSYKIAIQNTNGGFWECTDAVDTKVVDSVLRIRLLVDGKAVDIYYPLVNIQWFTITEDEG